MLRVRDVQITILTHNRCTKLVAARSVAVIIIVIIIFYTYDIIVRVYGRGGGQEPFRVDVVDARGAKSVTRILIFLVCVSRTRNVVVGRHTNAAIVAAHDTCIKFIVYTTSDACLCGIVIHSAAFSVDGKATTKKYSGPKKTPWTTATRFACTEYARYYLDIISLHPLRGTIRN